MKPPSLSATALAALLTIGPVNGGLIPTTITSLIARGPSGINNQGNDEFHCFFKGLQGTMATIKAAMNTIPIDTKFQPGDRIACGGFYTAPDGKPDHNAPFNDIKNVAGFCASICDKDKAPNGAMEVVVRSSTMGNNNDLADVIGDLIAHGASQCGTAPLVRTSDDPGARITYPGPNLLATGCITVQYTGAVCEAESGDTCPRTVATIALGG
ncbi:MAG: hypothetical protein Q9168_002064 [Polycauliona sp. 1 TL-2023]